MSIRISFFGAAGTVTGSKFLVTSSKAKVLIDAGLFQGSKDWRKRNWETGQIEKENPDAVLLTHAHIDHTGILPRLTRNGLSCPIFCTKGTKALSEILLPDAGRIQEEDAEYRASLGNSSHKPPLPLYTEGDALEALTQYKTVDYQDRVEVANGVYATWCDVGHILGAASILLEIDGIKIRFSGDIGRYDDPIMGTPKPASLGDLLLIESTYGTKSHKERNLKSILTDSVQRSLRTEGAVLIPSFAVGRTQQVLFLLRELQEEGKIPEIPIVVDSPMARDATEIYRKFSSEFGSGVQKILNENGSPFSPKGLYFIKSRSESIALNEIKKPMVIIAASGMLSGGRILHHMKHRIAYNETTIVFVGYQPSGGKGHHLLNGGKTIRLYHDTIPVKAQIEQASGLSAHSDHDELIKWCGEGSGTPSRVAVVHGEPHRAKQFSESLKDKFGWNASAPGYQDTWDIEL